MRQDANVAKAYSEHLDKDLSIDNIPSDIDLLSERIGAVVRDSLDKACPKLAQSKSNDPWENAELQSMMDDLRKTPKNCTLQKQIRKKCKSLKDQYYHEKAMAINNAAEACGKRISTCQITLDA